ncbi:hypothetical protein ROHU_002004 [Labeo rohita]|uniref:Uncharacterized protein n=1 Tax=Labeo rohita TaxID=84645 RepID=A0A498P0C8_LABRO|nr:hypothetical protein ROHU_002004 [Labeo rohita]
MEDDWGFGTGLAFRVVDTPQNKHRAERSFVPAYLVGELDEFFHIPFQLTTALPQSRQSYLSPTHLRF